VLEVHEKLISEAVTPVFDGDGGAELVVAGEPIIPGALIWRGTTYPILHMLSMGKGVGPCTHNSGERYVQKHWYRFETTGGMLMRVYFERKARGGQVKRRWWLYSVEKQT
tara:strand:- start:1120 stop:1449 length:330 start_codon:yes stop_codon:yes gene_type:complete